MYKSRGRTRVFTRIQNLQTSILEIGKYFHQEQSPNIRPLFCWLFVLIKPSIKYGHWARSTLRTKFDLKDPTSLQLLYNEQFVLAVLAVWNVESFLSILLIYKIQQIINNLTRLQSTNRSYYFAHALWSLLNTYMWAKTRVITCAPAGSWTSWTQLPISHFLQKGTWAQGLHGLALSKPRPIVY